MKRVIYVISCFIALLFMPVHVFAADGVEVNKTTLTIEQGTNTTFNITATNVAVHVVYKLSDAGIISIENVPDWIDSEPGQSLSKTIKVNGLKVGTSTINFDMKVATYDEKEFSKTIQVVVNVVPPKSSNNNLKELKIDGVSLKNFNASTTDYTLKNTDASSIVISATSEDVKATVSGTGTIKLSYGVNTLNVVVIAENGSKKTYTLKITRNDNRSGENLLSSLNVSVGKIEFDSKKTDYTVIVDNDVTEVKVDAKAKSSKANVSGIGTIKLKDGYNEIKVVVTAENGSKKTYKINVVKQVKDSDSSELSNNNDLKILNVEGYNINFSRTKKIYYLSVDENVIKLNIEAISYDPNAKVVVNNIDNLVNGENIITIDVTALNGDVKTYKVIVDKGSDKIEEDVHNCIYKILSFIELGVIVALIVTIVLLIKKKREY